MDSLKDLTIGVMLSWAILGLIAGAVAKAITPGRDPGGCIITIALGIGGALLGGYLGTLLGWGEVTGDLDLRNFGVGIGGSVLLLIVYRLIFGKKR